jgi:branched-chain amino acid transport system ATP-binding protein
VKLLELHQVSKRYGTLAAINNLSLSFHKGTLHSVIGPNGAGKTTLFNIISGESRPSGGRITFGGRDIQGLAPNRIARLGIGRSFQRTNLFLGLSVRDNVRIGARSRSSGNMNFFRGTDSDREGNARAESVLRETGLHSVAQANASDLSHGDQRVLELAVTLAGDPALLLLDEPTCGMSKDETARMVDLVKQLARDRTVILIEHNMPVVMSISDQITVLHNGEIIADGTPQAVRENPNVRRVYFGAQPVC